jgi:hypothetical protein
LVPYWTVLPPLAWPRASGAFFRKGPWLGPARAEPSLQRPLPASMAVGALGMPTIPGFMRFWGLPSAASSQCRRPQHRQRDRRSNREHRRRAGTQADGCGLLHQCRGPRPAPGRCRCAARRNDDAPAAKSSGKAPRKKARRNKTLYRHRDGAASGSRATAVDDTRISRSFAPSCRIHWAAPASRI